MITIPTPQITPTSHEIMMAFVSLHICHLLKSADLRYLSGFAVGQGRDPACAGRHMASAPKSGIAEFDQTIDKLAL